MLKCKISWKSVQWEPSFSMRMDGRKAERAELSKLIVAFHDFVKEHKFLLSAHSSFPAVGQCAEIKDSTARIKNNESVTDCEQDWQ
jgi:hypothetical protein